MDETTYEVRGGDLVEVKKNAVNLQAVANDLATHVKTLEYFQQKKNEEVGALTASWDEKIAREQAFIDADNVLLDTAVTKGVIASKEDVTNQVIVEETPTVTTEEKVIN